MLNIRKKGRTFLLNKIGLENKKSKKAKNRKQISIYQIIFQNIKKKKQAKRKKVIEKTKFSFDLNIVLLDFFKF